MVQHVVCPVMKCRWVGPGLGAAWGGSESGVAQVITLMHFMLVQELRWQCLLDSQILIIIILPKSSIQVTVWEISSS